MICVLTLQLEEVFSNKAKENQGIQYKGNSLKQISAEVKPIEKIRKTTRQISD